VRVSVYYDTVLVKVLLENKDNERLVIKYNGQEIYLPTTYDHAYELQAQLDSGKLTGQIGAARLVAGKAIGIPPVYYFEKYLDQTLRRNFEIDTFDYTADGYNVNCIGWRNQQNPAGFLAPKGVIPGIDGNFITDGTESFELDVPYQFTNLCTSMGSDTVSLLRDFIATACQIYDTPELPRADFYSSKGPEAEKLIAQYLDLVYQKKN